MLKEIRIEAEAREAGIKSGSRKLARQGKVPGVVYGGKQPPVLFQIDPRKMEPITHSEGARTTLFHFSVGDKGKPDVVIIKELQEDPLTGNLMHADLMRIDMSKTIQVQVPVHLIGTPIGVKQQGGVLDFVNREVEILSLPGDIPERIDVDVSGLELGNALKVSDLSFADNVKVMDDPNTAIVSVQAPAAEKAAASEEAEAEGEAPAEPEVIAKGKADEEGEAKPKEGEGAK